MKGKLLVSTLVLGALAVGALASAGVVRTVSAAVDTVQAAAVNSEVGSAITRVRSVLPQAASGSVEMGMSRGGGGFTDEQLATALGITVDKLTAARETAKTAAIDEALSKGLITQAQADALKSGSGVLPFAGRWSGWLSQNGIDYDALLAKALGISVDDLSAARVKAFSAAIDQAVTDGRLTQEQADLIKGQQALLGNQTFQNSMQSAFEAAVAQAVKDGVITQAQADAILAAHSSQSQHGWGLGGRGMGGFGGRHGGRGGFDHDFAPNGTTPTTPAVPSEVTPSSSL